MVRKAFQKRLCGKCTYSLVLEYGSEVANDVNDAKYDAVLRADGQVRAVSIARDRVLRRDCGEKVMHASGRADLVRSSVDGEDENEDDNE